MFTGIVEERGIVIARDGARLVIDGRVVADESPVGASVAVNGTCLTVVASDGAALAFDLSDETIARTTLGGLASGDRGESGAAREPRGPARGAHRAGACGRRRARSRRWCRDEDGGAEVRVAVPADLLRYVVHKGSITVDGVSLTVAGIEGDAITIALIPHTLAATTLGVATTGDRVNLEVDVLAKYVERLMERD